MKQSQPIEIIQPTLRRRATRPGLPLVEGLTIGAAVLAIVLSVSLSAAANRETCARPIDASPGTPEISHCDTAKR